MLTTGLFRRKSLDQLVNETADPKNQLRRTLGPLQLTMLGVGAIVGAGIFSTPGTAAAGGAEHIGAGPALVISFLLVAVACGFAALCYSEFAAMVPVSGSAYTYAYATLGELAAWLIGWDLILEYAISNAAVAVSWSGYFQVLLDGLHLHMPNWLGTDFRSALQAAAQVAGAPAAHLDPGKLDPSVLHDAMAWQTAPQLAGLRIIFNLPAFGIVMLVTWIVLIGIRETARFNTALVIGKLAIVVFFLVLGSMYVLPENWTPFAPNGLKGISSAAAIIFFAYIGFDAVSTAAEETRNPQRDMPIGIIASLIICTVLYIAVTIVLTGMVPYNQIDVDAPVAQAFERVGLRWGQLIISFGAVAGITSVMLVLMLSQPRVLLAMARDGLLPESFFGAVHPRFRTPWKSTILTGLLVGAMAAFIPLGILAELVNIGTLLAFVIVCIAVLVMRYLHPQAERPFRCPWVPLIPVLGVLCCLLLMFSLPSENWLRLFIWMLAGMLIYFLYGRHHSTMAQRRRSGLHDG